MGIEGSAGLLTRGFGVNHKVLTRGFGARLDLGGVLPSAKRVEYDFNISAAISKEILSGRQIYCPFEVNKKRELIISSQVFKEVEEDVNVKINLDYHQLSDALDMV